MNQTDTSPSPPLPAAVYALGLLMVAGFISLLDRYAMGLLIEPIKQEMGISDTQIGLLQGPAFAIVFSVMALPFGRLVDRTNRRNVIIVGMVFWSLMTIGCGLAQNYWQLFVMRFGVGIGEACLAPAAYSLITDFFDPKRHGRALTFYVLSTAIGGGGSYAVCGALYGALSEHASSLPTALASLPIWRLTFLALGIPGFVAAALLLSVREPVRRQSVSAASATPGSIVRYLERFGPAFWTVTIAHTLCGFVTTGVALWAPSVFIRKFDVSIAWAGANVGFAFIGAVTVAGVLGAAVADQKWLLAHGGRKLWLTVVSAVLAAPCLAIWPRLETVEQALAIYSLWIVTSGVQATTAAAVLQDIVPSDVKGQATAIYWLCLGVAGLALGPATFAAASDYIFGGSSQLPLTLATLGPPIMASAALVAVFGMKRYGAAVRVVTPTGVSPASTTSPLQR